MTSSLGLWRNKYRNQKSENAITWRFRLSFRWALILVSTPYGFPVRARTIKSIFVSLSISLSLYIYIYPILVKNSDFWAFAKAKPMTIEPWNFKQYMISSISPLKPKFKVLTHLEGCRMTSSNSKNHAIPEFYILWGLGKSFTTIRSCLIS